MTKRKARVKVSDTGSKAPTESGDDSRKSILYGRGGPGGAQEGRADLGSTGSQEEEVHSQSQAGSAIAQGPGRPEKPVDVGAESHDLEKTPGVPGGLSGMENMGNTGVHRGTSEYPDRSPAELDLIGSKRAGKKRKK